MSTAPPRVLAAWCPEWTRDDGGDGGGKPGFGQVVRIIEEFCPRVEVVRPGLCAIGAPGPARYFGGEHALAGKIAAAVAGHGFECRTGIADGLFAAQLATVPGTVVPRGGTRQFLAPYPVSVLRNAELAGLLARLGIRTLGDFAALPAGDVLSRFGSEGAAAQRTARGCQPRPLVTRLPPADLSLSQEFDPPAEQAEPVVFAAKSLADRMHAGLAARGLACVRVEITAAFGDGREVTRLWRHDGLLSALAVAQRVRWQLDGWRPGQPEARHPGDGPPEDGPPGDCRAGEDGAPGDCRAGEDGAPGDCRAGEDGCGPGGIAALRLVPDQLVPGEGRQLGLWGDDVVSDRAERAAARVQAMLGHDAVMHPALGGGRGPAEQVTLTPFGGTRDSRLPADRPWPGRIPPPEPATVYRAPVPARVTDVSGAPVKVTGRAWLSADPAWLSAPGRRPLAVTAWAGPWPVTQRWWEPSGTRKARFQLVTADGACLAAVKHGGWQVEASYD